MNTPGIVSLLTDFGHDDEYVGVVKAVILKYSPTAKLVDICHTIPPQDIHAAARMLETSYSFFSEGTVHLAVVDPGVGTDRDILMVETDRYTFVAPDNGILTTVLQSPELKKSYRLPKVTGSAVSSTFHGRDIMAPAAGKIAAGALPETLGEEIDAAHCATLPPMLVRITEKEIIGEVTGIDRFGNIATSIKAEHIRMNHADVEIEIGGTVIPGMVTTYADVEKLVLAALIDSRGNLEIAMNHGNAAGHLGSRRGDSVVVRLSSAHGSH